MDDLLKSLAFPGQTRFLAEFGDALWEEITGYYDLYEPVDGRRLVSLHRYDSDRYKKLYAQLVLKNVAVEHALGDTGTPQVVRRGNTWVLCDPEVETKTWPQHRDYALRLAKCSLVQQAIVRST